jgi:PAS domain S-box-containing protein
MLGASFERVRRIENARGRTHEGSGIGLALVQELVKLHHGSIAVESVFGQGTTFRVAMPLGASHLPHDQIVEGMSVVSTANRAGPFVDFGLLRELRADPRTRSIPIIMHSARAGEESRVEGMQAGADDYLVRPFGSRELLARVSAHLRMARIHREANESLRESEDRLRMALTAARMVAWQWNPADGLVHTSDNAADLFGLPEGIVLTNLNQGVALVHPDDIETYRRTFTRTIEDRGSDLISYRLIRPVDGSVVWMEKRGHAICDESARVVQLVGVVMDVNERKKAEEEVRDARSRLESTLVAGEIGTWEFDVVSIIVRADLNLARMFHLETRTGSGRPARNYTKSIHPDDQEREEFRPEMILLDFGLPGMDGNEVARSIGRFSWGDDLVIIALTG